MKQSIPYLFLSLGFLILFLNCKDRSVTPPEATTPEISDVELSIEQIIVNDTVLITVKLSEELGEEYVLKWQLSGYQTEIDTITSEAVFSWKAPKVHGSYEHSVQIVSVTGEAVSEVYLFSTDISSVLVEPVEGNKLVFSMPEADGDHQIFSMNLDGTELKQLTFFERGEAYEPSWSPDGKRIVFTGDSLSTSLGTAIYVMDSDGSNIKPMKRWDSSPTAVYGSNPKWSPDGTRIVFSAYTDFNNEIVIYNFEVDSIDRITNNNFFDWTPDWNPESNQITFQSRREVNPVDSSRLGNDIYVMDKDGGNVQRVTETGSSRNPVWHPESNLVVFRESSNLNKLMTVDVETKTTMQIQEPFEEELPLWAMAWSSDSSQLLVQIFDGGKYTFHILDIHTGLATIIPLELENYSNIDWYQFDVN